MLFIIRWHVNADLHGGGTSGDRYSLCLNELTELSVNAMAGNLSRPIGGLESCGEFDPSSDCTHQ